MTTKPTYLGLKIRLMSRDNVNLEPTAKYFINKYSKLGKQIDFFHALNYRDTLSDLNPQQFIEKIDEISNEYHDIYKLIKYQSGGVKTNNTKNDPSVPKPRKKSIQMRKNITQDLLKILKNEHDYNQNVLGKNKQIQMESIIEKINTEKKNHNMFFYATNNGKIIKQMFYLPEIKQQLNNLIIFDNENKYIYDIYNPFNDKIDDFINRMLLLSENMNRMLSPSENDMFINILMTKIDEKPKILFTKLNDFSSSIKGNNNINCRIADYDNQYYSLINDYYNGKGNELPVKINLNGVISIGENEYKLIEAVIFTDLYI